MDDETEQSGGGPFYLGFDLSTQSVKAVVTNDALQVVQEVSVKFDQDLPEFGTSGGANRDPTNSKVVTAQPIMWVKAMGLVLEKLRLLEPPLLDQIVGISGAGQQHGSVFWKRGGLETLRNLDPDKFLHDQLAFAFAIQNSPIWMDSSTSEYCDMLEKAVGGAEVLAKLTGSRAYERFTGSQISKIFHTKREAYNATERISLVSSFIASIFLGSYAAIDYSDASGMNLLDIREKTWSPICLAGVVPEEGEGANLAEKLGPPTPTEAVLGTISPYFVERYGFSSDCKVVAFTGDNPSSFAEMCLGANDIAVSLGTSDTLFLSMPSLPQHGFGEGHIFVNPIASKDHYMALLCFKNGSLTRERIRRDYANGSWSIFNELLDSTPRGNFGNVGFYYDLWEIIPKIKNGDHKFNKEGSKLTKFTSNEVEVRALIEGQFLSRRLHAEKIGCKITKETKILATGGGSANPKILQILSDVFNAPVYVQGDSNSADLGACYRVKHALYGEGRPFDQFIQSVQAYQKVWDPNKDAKEIYDKMLQRFAILEQTILNL
ncbi:xylulose kinase isoform X2 [Folsomia candida]|uniref:Xylulose kinase n=2 Tax=Folsomia candida TaxID=158441 RepID=A0A226CZK6_FOLCA|nr:xylulose kinase isoform X2 [Folsomia candida]XP_021967078.1 xylulose kinase isoform X2 [Folsomia candida]XP_021967079.1 xylulose kinase isoform X2 [Folsomia candida]XP_021967080.1 xylulose kinase isoform X2 [Folsomia candida]OXA37978.1 Xylulose kinase [Folsomia candida]